MKKLLFISILLFFSLLQVSCNTDAISNNNPIANSVDVYVAGSKDGKACYWKNGQVIMLNSGTFTATIAKKIIVNNGNVYVLGENTTADPTIYLYWKNGVLTNLTTTLNIPTFGNTLGITDMDVSGNDVYFVGYIPSVITIPNPPVNLVYWKNNVATIVKEYNSSFYNTVSFIKVLNNVVYVAGPGTTNNANFAINGYYANNIFNEIPNSQLSGFDVKNNQIFAYGTQNSVGFYYNMITNVNSTVSFQAGGGIEKMCFDNNNIYYSNSQQIYKNGTIFHSSTMTQSFITDYKIVNNNFYKIATTGGVVLSYFLEINGVTILVTSTDEIFESLFVVQN
jgi:hypothetical protein